MTYELLLLTIVCTPVAAKTDTQLHIIETEQFCINKTRLNTVKSHMFYRCNTKSYWNCSWNV